MEATFVQVLDPHVADLIAAGEVVERPASAAKELIENAVDAGATSISVESAGGGSTLLRVTDNGCGMSSSDAKLAFLRHATSKIRTAEDLSAVTTLGFRGEALAAICAVSKVQLLTRERGSAMGCMINMEAGQLVGHREAGCPEGTTIVIRDLFHNTPARQKFLKKDVTETAHIQAVCQRAAMSCPSISFLYIRDGRQALLTPGDGQLRACLYGLFGGTFVSGLCEVRHTQGFIHVGGFVSRPEAAHGNRNAQYVLVNSRPVRSRAVTAALEEAFKNSLTSGLFPACVLHIQLPPGECDVNVHPAKAEIKFSRERDVFDAVYVAVRQALDGIGRPHIAGGEIGVASASNVIRGSLAGASDERATPAYQAAYDQYVVGEPDVSLLSEHGKRYPSAERFIGEALGGYLIVETGEGLAIIDKHAAHERILYNKLKASAGNPSAQILLSPMTVTLSPADSSILLESADVLSDTGFSLEDFDGALVVREAPAEVDLGDIPALLGEMAAKLREGRRDPRPRLLDNVQYLVACKAAIKLGKQSPASESEALARRVLDDPNLRHCPHGRPICVVFSRAAIQRAFGR